MKKILNYILVTAILGTFLPYSALAETTNVGVNITGSASIDVVTTISANITLDLTTGETTPTYMEIKNNSLVPVNAKITDISTTSEGAPSTFVGQADKDWNNLSREETETYVNFNILGEGQNVKPKDILANTELDLGVISEKIGYGATGSGEIDIFVESSLSHLKVYEINANFGKNWSSGDKNFTYQITTVYSQTEEYADPTLSYAYPEMQDVPNIKSMKLIDIVAHEDLTNYNINSIPTEKVSDYYYLFAFDIEDGIGGFSTVESEIALYLHDEQGDMSSYSLILNANVDNVFQNYTIDFETGSEYYGLLVPAKDITSTETGNNYKTLHIYIVKPVSDSNSGKYSAAYFDNSNTIYNYTYILKYSHM